MAPLTGVQSCEYLLSGACPVYRAPWHVEKCRPETTGVASARLLDGQPTDTGELSEALWEGQSLCRGLRSLPCQHNSLRKTASAYGSDHGGSLERRFGSERGWITRRFETPLWQRGSTLAGYRDCPLWLRSLYLGGRGLGGWGQRLDKYRLGLRRCTSRWYRCGKRGQGGFYQGGKGLEGEATGGSGVVRPWTRSGTR